MDQEQKDLWNKLADQHGLARKFDAPFGLNFDQFLELLKKIDVDLAKNMTPKDLVHVFGAAAWIIDASILIMTTLTCQIQQISDALAPPNRKDGEHAQSNSDKS